MHQTHASANKVPLGRRFSLSLNGCFSHSSFAFVPDAAHSAAGTNDHDDDEHLFFRGLRQSLAEVTGSPTSASSSSSASSSASYTAAIPSASDHAAFVYLRALNERFPNAVFAIDRVRPIDECLSVACCRE